MNFHPKVLSFALAGGLLVAACGGGGTENGTGGTGIINNGVPTLEAKAVSTTSTEVLVVTDTSNATATKQYEVSKYLFTANVTEGKYKGTALSGDLMLGAKELGSSEIKGTLLIRPAVSTPAGTNTTSTTSTTSIDTALAQCRSATDVAYTEAQKAFKAAVETLQAALKAAKTQAEALAALEAFEKQYKAISKAARDKAQAACADLLKLTGDVMEKDDKDDEKESDDDKPKASAIPVTGKFNADGSVSLSIKVRKLGTIKGVGKPDAKGNLAGTFTGPDALGKGTWTASITTGTTTTPTPSTPPTTTTTTTTPPPPPPPPPPGPSVSNGSMLYGANCVMCHTKAAAAGLGGASAAGIKKGIANVGSMRSLSTLTDQQIQDIAAYVGS